MEDNFIEKLMKSIEKRHGKETSDLAYYILALFILGCILALAITHVVAPLYFLLEEIGILKITILVLLGTGLIFFVLNFYSQRKIKKLEKEKKQILSKATELLDKIEERGKEYEEKLKETEAIFKAISAKYQEEKDEESTST